MSNVSQQQSSLADFELLTEVSQLLTVIDLDHVLQRVIDLAARSVGASKASVFLHHQHSDKWQRLLTPRNLDPKETVTVVQSVLDKGLAGWVMQHRQGTIVDDTQTDSRWLVFPNDTKPVRSAMCLPLMQNDEVIAVVTLEHPEPHHFTDHHLRLLTIITNQAAVAVRNAQLFNQMLEHQRQLEATLHAIPDVLLVVNDAGDILLASDAALELLGLESQEEVVGRSLASLLDADSAFAPLQDVLDHPVRNDETRTYETRSDRKRRDFVVMATRWENDFGGTAGHVVVMHDVTQMRDLNRFKGEMLKMASHDLRSPIAMIVGYSDLISMDTPDPNSTIHEYLKVIRHSTDRMQLLLDDLLRVEEIRTSPAELHEPTDFAQLVEGVVENLQMVAYTRNQTVEVEVSLDGLELLTLDPALIREAMENLTSNASKYTPEGGRICVTSYYDDRRVHFIVQDNGIGISEHDVTRVFDWGFRSKKHTGQTIEGKGLGLSLVKTVLERHGGEVWVESQEGVGSRFGFWLPR